MTTCFKHVNMPSNRLLELSVDVLIPYADALPASTTKSGEVSSVSAHVTRNPHLPVNRKLAAPIRVSIPVPKVTIDQNRDLKRRKHHVGRTARYNFEVLTIPVAHAV